MAVVTFYQQLNTRTQILAFRLLKDTHRITVACATKCGDQPTDSSSNNNYI